MRPISPHCGPSSISRQVDAGPNGIRSWPIEPRIKLDQQLMTGRLHQPTASAENMFAFPANSELRIAFVPFRVHISFHEGQRLTVKVVEGENAGFMDTVDYRAIRVRQDIVVLSWQEHIGSTIVHVLDFANDRSYTYVTPEKGGFLRLSGTLGARSVEMD